MTTYYCRICWNDNGWRYPSVHKNESGYVRTQGFGHEEWLFNDWTNDDGYKYAFVQPMDKRNKKKAGELADLVLWTIRRDKERCLAGVIRNCRHLTSNEAKKALAEHKKKGWFDQMQEEVDAVDGDKEKLDSPGLFNIRFRRKDATVFDPPRPFVKVPPEIGRYYRYHLVKVQGDDVRPLVSDWSLKGKPDLPSDKGEIIRGSLAPTSFDPQEKRLQRRLMELLREEFGKECVRREGGFGAAPFDLVVRSGRRTILIEMKAYADARRAIREALGQILEYTFFDPKVSHHAEKVELFIVAPAPINDRVSKYVDLLRTRFSIPVNYCSFSLTDSLPKALVDRSRNFRVILPSPVA